MTCARDDQSGETVGMLACEMPGDDPSPVVSDENRVGHVHRVEYAEGIVDQRVEAIGLDVRGARGRAVAALVDLDRAQTRFVQASGDVVEAGAVHREPVQHEDPRSVVGAADADVEGQVADSDLAPLSFHSTNPSGVASVRPPGWHVGFLTGPQPGGGLSPVAGATRRRRRWHEERPSRDVCAPGRP